jgi:DNA-binding CsgD family transcriptional regulator
MSNLPLQSDAPQSGRPLSNREAQILAMTSRGLTNFQIASRLTISVHAVKFHLASVYRKLGVGNRTEAAYLYLQSEANGRAITRGD